MMADSHSQTRWTCTVLQFRADSSVDWTCKFVALPQLAAVSHTHNHGCVKLHSKNVRFSSLLQQHFMRRLPEWGASWSR